ncbi:response regulator transcription factor [Nakamurella sp. A5-74]|uniref:Response regulator transcription factor n=1 Tax=Nakamurella sp. A5-74 TaxID=3158264 RepID=A0AAU8DQ41_9ACTN
MTQAAPPIKVFLVDDQMLVRTGFRMLVEAQDDMVVVGEAPDGRQAIAALVPGGSAADAEVVLMDVRMPVLDGVRATQEIVAAHDAPARSGPAAAGPGAEAPVRSGPKVLVLTTFDIDEYVFAALRAGASGFLLKDARPEDLLGAIRSVAAGDSVVAPSATRRLIATVVDQLPGPDRASAARLDVLTAREREVLQLIAAGATNPEIAIQLYMAEATVKTHVGRLLSKLAVRDRVGLVLVAYETGLVRS